MFRIYKSHGPARIISLIVLVLLNSLIVPSVSANAPSQGTGIDLTADQTNLKQGQCTILYYSIPEGWSQVNIFGWIWQAAGFGMGGAIQSSQEVCPISTKTYTISGIYPDGTKQASIVIIVSVPPPPTEPPSPPTEPPSPPTEPPSPPTEPPSPPTKPPSPPTEPPPVVKQSLDYFALGDSIASGHGLMDEGEPCRRSSRSYPKKVAEILSTNFMVSFPENHFLACSGATAGKPKAKPKGDGQNGENYKWLHNQFIDMMPLIRDDRPTLVTISIGANDFGWLDFSRGYYPLAFDGDVFLKWTNQVAEEVANQLYGDLKLLLDDHHNVKVVITLLYNPFNKESVFFGGPIGDISCRDSTMTTCYEKTEYAIVSLNHALVSDVWVKLGKPDQIRFASTDVAFYDHASPCGTAFVSNTWIQYPGDKNSNSIPVVPDWLKRISNNTGLWLGDCIHPNEEGAQGIADLIITAFTRDTSETSVTQPPISSSEFSVPLPPPPTLPSLFVQESSFCRAGPGLDYEDYWMVYEGESHPVLAKWYANTWLLVGIDSSGTRTKCCWVGGSSGQVSGEFSSLPVLNYLVDRMTCSLRVP
jgi:lysophospholipase L1-like esterase